MAYSAEFPKDDSYLADFPAGEREQIRAIKDDQIVDAGKLQGLVAGNENGNIPISNGVENKNLNAALLNGKASGDFATKNHTHVTATQSSNGFMSNTDKKKLDSLTSGAEVNQNAFSNIKIGETIIQADSKQDTLELTAGANISIIGDNNNDKAIISVSGKVPNAIKADSTDIATRATQDQNGDNISDNYLKKDNGVASSLICANDIFGGQLIIKRNSANAASIKFTNASNVNRYIGFTGSDKIMYKWGDNGENQIAFLDSSNYNNYAPTKTGGGASGTWGISVTGSATKATQDKNGRDITGYLYKNENIELNSNANIVASGTILAILNAFCTKFKNIQGTGAYADNPPTSLQSLNDSKASKDSPSFSGTPTAPTQDSSDNSTKIATTAFVQSLISALSNTINSKSQVYIGGGRASVNGTYTIPLPSGYSRNQCKYAVSFIGVGSGSNASYYLEVDQSNGVVSGQYSHTTTGHTYRDPVSFGYLIIAVK